MLKARAAGSSSQPVLFTELPDKQADGPERTKKPAPLRALAPPWWVMPPEAEQASRKFDVGLVALSGRVERLNTTLEEDPTHTLAAACHSVAMRELYRHRYFVPEFAAKAAGKIKGKQKAKKKNWRLEESIWARRARTSDSKAFLDSDECERDRFAVDWQEALSHKLEGFIMRTDKKEKGATSAPRGGARGGPASKAGGDAPPENQEVQEVRDVLWEHHDMLYMTFFYYASQEDKPNVFMINYLSYQRFYEDCSLAVAGSIGCQPRNLDQMFVAINASGKGTDLHAKEKNNDQHSLNRQEFLQLLVRVAQARYIMTGQVHDVSDAVRMVVEQDVLDNVVPECLHDLNTFREHYCYLEEVDHILRRHETSLRALYKEFARDLDGMIGKGSTLMGFDEWMAFLQSVHVVDHGKGGASTQFCSHRHGTLAFVWSRMAVVGSEEDDAVVLKTQNLHFEDFLEALVRIATMVGWPTDEEIEQAGYRDAGEFLLNMQQFSHVYDRFMAKNATSWDEEPRQPIERCIAHLLAWVIRVVAAAG